MSLYVEKAWLFVLVISVCLCVMTFHLFLFRLLASHPSKLIASFNIYALYNPLYLSRQIIFGVPVFAYVFFECDFCWLTMSIVSGMFTTD